MGVEVSKAVYLYPKGSLPKLLSKSSINTSRSSHFTPCFYRTHYDTDSMDDKGFEHHWYKGRNSLQLEDSAYMLPFDDTEYDRQNAMHYVMKLAKGNKNFLSPIDKIMHLGGSILDIGCSSGVWCLDTANDYPDVHITGVDTLDIFPHEIKPSNTSFVQANVLKGLPFADNTFAFVHIRFMNLALRVEEWPVLLAECVRVCKKDGFIEVIEPDMEPWKCGPLYTSFVTRCNRVLEARSIHPHIPRKMKGFMEDAGIQDIKMSLISFPIGKWGNKIGELFLNNVRNVVQSSSSVMLAVLGFSAEKYAVALEEALEETSRFKGYHTYTTMIGRKKV